MIFPIEFIEDVDIFAIGLRGINGLEMLSLGEFLVKTLEYLHYIKRTAGDRIRKSPPGGLTAPIILTPPFRSGLPKA